MKTDKRAVNDKICALEFAVNAISGKWKIPIIWQMNKGLKRPSEFLRGIATVDRRVLNQQLKEMEADGLISRKSFAELPPRVEYTLTELGQQLVEVLWKLDKWGELLLESKGHNNDL